MYIIAQEGYIYQGVYWG